ncbi:MAG: hypothetical protein HWQ35_12375 [Nostoc sp. NMS1]|nr:hypothetical protein [Nostoc sp. NMS1]MBN3907322.1 hypothetical protein [Nostoc sp. NMS1]
MIYAIAEIIEPPKIIVNSPDIGYWIDTSCVGIKPCANELKRWRSPTAGS